MPPAKKAQDSAAPNAAQPSVIDQMADDAAPPDYPEGTPELLPYLQIRPRGRRAQFKRKYAEVVEFQAKVAATHKGVTDKSPMPEQMRMAADLDDLYQQVDELMEIAAVDPQAYRAWSDEVDDAVLSETFQVFTKRSQPGEASSSAS